ncbi:hypothetical protein ACOME3_002389 [Neoechinorhynchus agilis]
MLSDEEFAVNLLTPTNVKFKQLTNVQALALEGRFHEALCELWPDYHDKETFPIQEDVQTAIIALQVFVHSNYYSIDFTPTEEYTWTFIDNEPTKYPLKHPHLLHKSREILMNEKKKWWLLRVSIVCADLLNEPTDRLIQTVREILNTDSDNHLFNLELFSGLARLQMWTDAEQILKTRLVERSRFSICLKGVLGKRSKYQTHDIAQLVASAVWKKFEDTTWNWVDSRMEAFETIGDDVCYGTPMFANLTTDNNNHEVDLSSLEQCLMINIALLEEAIGIRGGEDIDRESLLAYLDVLNNTKCVFEVRRCIMWRRCKIDARQLKDA